MRQDRNDRGASLMIVLAFILISGFIIGGLGRWIQSDVSNVAHFSNARGTQYSLSGAMTVAINTIRYNPLIGQTSEGASSASPPNQTLNAGANPSYCFGSPSPTSTFSSAWTSPGSSTLGSSPYGPAAQVPSGSYMYLNTGVVPTSIHFYANTDVLGNVFFGSNSSGSGYMVHAESRPGNSSGFAATSSWTSWNAPTSGPVISANVWHKFDVTISGGSATASIDGTVIASNYPVTSLGTYLGLSGDGGGGTTSFADLVVNGAQIPIAPSGASTVSSINGDSESVWCSTVWNPSSTATRIVTLDACPSTVSATKCAATPSLQAVVTFDDYPKSGYTTINTVCTATCGDSMKLDSWISNGTYPNTLGPVPSAPTGVTASYPIVQVKNNNGNGNSGKTKPDTSQANVSWSGSASSYTAVATDVSNPIYGGQSCTSSTTSCTITNLNTKDNYTVVVYATNSTGDSNASSPASVN